MTRALHYFTLFLIPGVLVQIVASRGVRRNVTIDSRIIGGQLARARQFPYQAALFRNNRPNCGGTLISTTYVLTAGHCVHDNGGRGPRFPANQMSVRLGSLRLSSGGTVIPVAEIKVHPQFRFPVFDLSLLRLARAAQLSNTIRPIRPSNRHVNVGTQLIVSGWGALRTGGFMDEQLRFVNLTAISDQECFRRTPASPSVFCLGHPQGRGICQGDSGGPAVANNLLIGANSFTLGGGCGTTSPDGFAKVSFMFNWIIQNSR